MDTMIDSNTLRLVRVFDAWAVQDQFAQWMCPPGVMIDQCVIDVRPGGAWRIKGRHDGGRRFASSGVSVAVTAPIHALRT